MSTGIELVFVLVGALLNTTSKASARKTVDQYYDRFSEQYNDLKSKGAEAYIPEEMARLSADIEQIRDLRNSDPEEANRISQKVDGYIYDLPELATEAEAAFDQAVRMQMEAKREKKQRQRSSALEEYYQQIQNIDPSVVHFGMKQLQQLKENIESGSISRIDDIRSQISSIRKEAEKSAAAWKQSTHARVKTQSVQNRLQATDEILRKKSLEDQKTAQMFTDQLTMLQEDLAAGRTTAAEAESAVEKIISDVDQEKVSEEVRRQAVIAIIKQLRDQGFAVDAPKLTNVQGESYVLVTAKQPSGHRATCKIGLNGKMQYCFDHYEGMACLKDIQKFQVDLERIYSIKFSDERVIWENPDRLTRTEDSAPTGGNERSHG